MRQQKSENFHRGRRSRRRKQNRDHRLPEEKTEKKAGQPTALPLLRGTGSLLLDLPLRFCHLPGMHGGKLLGHVVQRDHLAVPGLRAVERIWQPVVPAPNPEARPADIVRDGIISVTYCKPTSTHRRDAEGAEKPLNASLRILRVLSDSAVKPSSQQLHRHVLRIRRFWNRCAVE